MKMNIHQILVCMSALLGFSFGSEHCSRALHESSGRVWIESGRVLKAGKAKSIVAVICESREMNLQLWEHIDNRNYKLVWDKLLPAMNDVLLSKTIVVNLATSEYIDISSKHRIGIYVPDHGTVPIQKGNGTTPQLIYSSNTITTPIIKGTSHEFLDLPFPYTFEVDFCMQQHCPELFNREEVTILPTENAPEENAGTAECMNIREGNNNLYLEQLKPLPIGNTIKAVKAYFCSSKPINLQILKAHSNGKYSLAWNKVLSNNGLTGRWLSISLQQSEWFVVESDHRLALFSSHSGNLSTPVKFFNGNNLIKSPDKVETLQECQQYDFNDLAFPYSFLVELCTSEGCADNTTPSTDGKQLPQCEITTTTTEETTTRATSSEETQNNNQSGKSGQTINGCKESSRISIGLLILLSLCLICL